MLIIDLGGKINYFLFWSQSFSAILVYISSSRLHVKFLLTVLPLNIWDIMIGERPSSEEWHIAFRLGSS
jgi:hypothetical protein